MLFLYLNLNFSIYIRLCTFLKPNQRLGLNCRIFFKITQAHEALRFLSRISTAKDWWSSKRICLCWPLIIRVTKASERIKAMVRHVRYRNSFLTDSKAKPMHLVFLYLPLSVLFLNHTLQHDGGVGSRWKHQQELQQTGEKRAIQSKHCLARAHDKRWTNKNTRGERKSHAQHCTSCKGRAIGCDALCFPSTLYHSVSLFLVSLYTAASRFFSARRCVYIYIYLYTHKQAPLLARWLKTGKLPHLQYASSTPAQAGSTWSRLASDNDPYEIRWWCSPALLKISVYITTHAFRAD